MDETRYWKLLQDILHGDQEHKEWLTEAFVAAWDEKPVPGPRGSGTKDRLYQELITCQRKIAELLTEIEDLKTK